MPKLVMMRGLPASGKTTAAKELLIEDGNMVRVNKDQLRPMLHGDRKWSGKQEGVTSKLQKALVSQALEQNKNVVVDDTNLGQRHYDKWSGLARDLGHKFEMFDLSHVDVKNCIRRDFYRSIGDYVGRDVIYNMAHQHGYVKQETPLAIFDLDGTLADITARRQKALREDGSMDWNEFFRPHNVRHLDTPRPEIFEMVNNAIRSGYEVNIVSGRLDVTRFETENWLMEHGERLLDPSLGAISRSNDVFPWWNRLIMRQEGDHRPDDDLKLWFLDNFLDASKIAYVVDDRPRVIRTWQSRGLNVVDVGPKDEHGKQIEF